MSFSRRHSVSPMWYNLDGLLTALPRHITDLTVLLPLSEPVSGVEVGKIIAVFCEGR